jgi:hypothetical protein
MKTMNTDNPKYRASVTDCGHYWTVCASHDWYLGGIGSPEYIDKCCPSDLPLARRRVIARAKRIFQFSDEKANAS